MARFRGLTWDHPRGRLALERAAATATDVARERLIDWDAQPLEGFEASPIEELAARYDVIVLDHPHLGDAIAAGAVRPLDTLFPAEFLAEVSRGAVGPSAASYTLEGRLWALPLDAATQVAVSVPELVPTSPRTWAEVADLATVAPVALSLAGPHAFLTFASLCVALGSEPSVVPGAGFIDPVVGERALAMLTGIARTLPPGTADLNPIGLLERMRRERDIAHIPLVYGYVNYASGPDPLRFDDAPGVGIATRRGSTIGGTGIAISTRCDPDAALIAHLAGLLDSEVQRTRIPADAGQPSLRSAWTDDAVNSSLGDFYRRTIATIEESWVRPRVAGYIPFQAAASAVLREAILRGRPGAVDHVNDLFDRLAAVPERSIR
ncbi:extracellular solute-binding protein [Agromyces sp. SYSU K20354]|uniref:extracellular solute-binding protein n=1 Tax=Agromyces cavernae TaxID=2898659 RepID=UPI001E4E4AFB|nr:extracellular solute-binding protein [Agromyces cavernae]MCD2443421.1 extracellular solute-binding protein [Agromyces cavernae]